MVSVLTPVSYAQYAGGARGVGQILTRGDVFACRPGADPGAGRG